MALGTILLRPTPPPDAVTWLEVMDGEGRPLVGVEVSGHRPSSSGAKELWQAHTDETGRLELPTDASEEEVLRLSRQGYASASLRRRDLAGWESQVSLSSPESITATKSQAPTQSPLTGTVADPQGRPMPETLVALEMLIMGELAPLRLSETRTDSEGRFSMSWPDRKRLQGGIPTLVAQAEGYAESRLGLPLPGPAELVLQNTRQLSGRVTDISGNHVIEGAKILVQGQQEESPLMVWTASETDSRGHFSLSLPWPLPVKEIHLTARASGYAMHGAHIESEMLDADSAPLSIALTPGVPLQGHVWSGEPGKPVAGARVLILQQSLQPVAHLVCDDQGAFDAGAVPRVPLILVVRAEEHLELHQSLTPGADPLALDLLLQPGVTMSFVVQDEDGNALPDARAMLETDEQSMGFDAQGLLITDDKGEIHSHALRVGSTWRLEVLHPGHVMDRREGLVPERSGEPITVRLRRGGVLELEVVDDLGEPVAGLLIAAQQVEAGVDETARGRGDMRVGRADARGHARINGLFEGLYQLQARSKEYDTTSLELEQAYVFDDAITRLLPMTVRRLGAIQGQALGAGWKLVKALAASAGAGGRPLETAIGSDGAFAFTGLISEAYTVWAEGPGRLPSAKVSVHVDPGATLEGLTLAAKAGGSLTGRVSAGLSSAGLDGARVEILADRAQVVASVQTDASGQFQFEGLENGYYQLRIKAQGHAPRLVEAQVPGSPIEVVLETGATLSGQVLRKGQPVPGLTIIIDNERSGGTAYSSTTDDQGRFAATNLDAGAYSITVADFDTNSMVERKVKLRGSEAIDLEIELP